MATTTVQVTEQMADFINWANTKGQDEIRRLIREHLAKIKEDNEKSKESRVNDGYEWDDALEPNDGDKQWKNGGDCNLCRKASYCGAKCRANKLLKKITTPYLYNLYLEDCPEAAVKAASGGMNTEEVMKNLGVLQ